MVQCGQVLELEEENEKSRDQMAMMAMEGPVAGYTSKQNSSAVLSSKCGGSRCVSRR
jgi:hypothetical protein